jgi:hypothetical protein
LNRERTAPTQRPIRHHPRDALLPREVGRRDEVLDGRRVHQHHVREREHPREERRGEERGVFDDDEATLVLVWDADLAQEAVRGFADDLPAPISCDSFLERTDRVPWAS